jgi:PleD family two-component response regulator
VLSRIEGVEVDYSGEKIRCRFSRGWADCKPGETSQELLNRADEALYQDKRTSKAQLDLSASKSARLPVS